MVDNKYTPIKIKFIKEEAKEKDKKGDIVVSKTPQGDINYTRNDVVGLMALLSKFDTRIHPLKDWKQSMKVRNKVRDAYLEDLEEIELTLDEAAFLKIYLKELPEKEGQQQNMLEHELRTLFGIQEQLESGGEK